MAWDIKRWVGRELKGFEPLCKQTERKGRE